MSAAAFKPAPAAIAAVESEKPGSEQGVDIVLAQYSHETQCLERAYLRTLQAGTLNSRRIALRRYLRSFAVRVDAARRANNKLPLERQVALAELFYVAGLIRWGKPIIEPASLWWKMKSSGGYRPIFDFGIVRRAACEALRPILEAHYEPRSFQYHGVHLAVRKIKEYFENGYEFVTQLDISNHYGSIDVDQLPKVLPLKKAVIDHVVAAKLIHVAPQGWGSVAVTPALIEEARRGIPQGSPIATLVAQIITSQLSWNHGPEAVMVNYADNFCVLSKSPHGADSATDALAAAIASVPGGKFSTKRETTVYISDGFEFIGHRFQMIDNELVVSPSDRAMKQFEARVKAYDDKAYIFLFTQRRLAPRAKMGAFFHVDDMWAFANSWARAFSECTTVDLNLENVRIVVDDYLKLMGIPWSEIEGHANPDAEWAGDLYD